jgi:hypothetical protein
MEFASKELEKEELRREFSFFKRILPTSTDSARE